MCSTQVKGGEARRRWGTDDNCSPRPREEEEVEEEEREGGEFSGRPPSPRMEKEKETFVLSCVGKNKMLLRAFFFFVSCVCSLFLGG